MITLTKIDGSEITINADEIEFIESTHDSVISMKSGRKAIVRETGRDIILKTIEYRRLCNTNSSEIIATNSAELNEQI